MSAESCPCRRVKCERHGDCEACREHHTNIKGSLTACGRIKAKAERKALRAERKSRSTRSGE